MKKNLVVKIEEMHLFQNHMDIFMMDIRMNILDKWS